jgi:CheY-like chemotaxis protein
MDNNFDALFAHNDNNDFSTAHYSWKILVVDDEKDVHKVTQLAFETITFEGKALNLLNAYSASQAKQMLKDNEDVAMVLLDVVMETDSAGLDLVKYIREDLENSAIRIVLRTGYPGKAPERKVIHEYDINDYWEKTDLTTDKLLTVIVSGLRSHKNYIAIEDYSSQLKREITRRKKIEKEREKLIEELKQALKNIKMLSGLLPICLYCKKIKDDSGNWNQLETYLYNHSEADFSHTICPDCAKENYPEYDFDDEE